jgi:hypothetical protein
VAPVVVGTAGAIIDRPASINCTSYYINKCAFEDRMMGIRQLAWATAACLLAAGVSAKGAIGIKGAKLAVSSPDGLNDATYSSVLPWYSSRSQC